MKECPYCNGEVSDIAKKCKHCGKWIENTQAETQLNIQKKSNLDPFERFMIGWLKTIVLVSVVSIFIALFVKYGNPIKHYTCHRDAIEYVNEKKIEHKARLGDVIKSRWNKSDCFVFYYYQNNGIYYSIDNVYTEANIDNLYRKTNKYVECDDGCRWNDEEMYAFGEQINNL